MLLVLLSAIAPSARADGGYFSGSKGARAAGRGGAYGAAASDLSAALYNPAGLSRIGGTMMQLGNRFSYNAYEFRRAPTLDWGDIENGVPPYVEFPAVDNDAPWQLLEPLLGVSSNVGLADWAFALTIQAPAGVGREEYPADGPQRYLMVSRDARILSYTASAAWKSGDAFGVGATLQWIHVPLLRYQLVIDANTFPGRVNPVRSELDMLATIEGSDAFTLNAILGTWIRPIRSLELALTVQVIPAEIETASTLTIDPQNPEIDDEVVLRRDGARANDVSLSLPLPILARAAVRYRHFDRAVERFDLELDVVYESWSRVEQFMLDTGGLAATLLGQRIAVDAISIDKAWRDTWSVRVGGDYHVLPELLTVRAGLFYETAVADSRYAHIDFAFGTQLGGALGASIQIEDTELAIAYEYRHQIAVTVAQGDARVFQEVPGSQCDPPYRDAGTCHPEFLGQRSPAVNAGRYRAHSHAVSLDVSHRF